MSGFLQALSFTTPWALAALALLPVIWWLLRFTPPRPQIVRFPPLRLLLELVSAHEQPDRTPWWLMLLRLAMAALVIIGVSRPFLAPGQVAALRGEALLLIIDDSWAASPGWDKRQEVMSGILDGARNANATVTLATTTPELRPSSLEAGTAETASARAATLQPRALDPDRMALLRRLKPVPRIIWLSDGLDDGTVAEFTAGLARLGKVEAIVPDLAQLPLALTAPGIGGGGIRITALRADDGLPREARAVARASNGRSLAEVKLRFTAGKAEGVLELPVELRNEVQRIDLEGQRNAAATFLVDDRWRRKSVGLLSGESLESAQPLLSPLYYVSRALEPFAELAEPADADALKQALDSGLSMLILADIGVLPDETQTMVQQWAARGGVLVRFAGPRMAGALAGSKDPLIPVGLRQGGRALGSALSWETPQAMQEFPSRSPFGGLGQDATVRISRQVLAEPDIDLPDKVWAVLADGTPLVTARREGKGLIVLFHVTANADWSNLPLTGLFVDMLRRVLDLAPAAGAGAGAAAAQNPAETAAFTPYRALSGTGDMIEAAPETKPVSAAQIDKAKASAESPPGLYRRGAQERAINIARDGEALSPVTTLPPGVTRRSLAPLPVQALAPVAFTAAFVLFLLDCLASLVLGGGFSRLRTRSAAAAVLLALYIPDARADAAGDFALRASLGTHLAYVVTGDGEIDQVSEAGLKGLGLVLRDRTSVDAAEPIGVNIESDEVVFFPLLYWPVRGDAVVPSDAALAKMDAYMKNGGTIFFDLREDGADALNGGASAASEALRRMLAKLDIPPLEPVPPEHVLTKSFYLLDSFPGRYAQGQLWVERSDAEDAAGNADGVSAIIVGANDYAAAWALDATGEGLYAVIPGIDRQREMAFRSGVNVVMYALTGNYKADQVHVPALLERLGQ